MKRDTFFRRLLSILGFLIFLFLWWVLTVDDVSQNMDREAKKKAVVVQAESTKDMLIGRPSKED
jgi:hypothetical protein